MDSTTSAWPPVSWAAATAGVLASFLAFLAWHYLLYSRNRGPVIWPFVGALPALIANFDRSFDWSLDNLRAHGTFRVVLPGMLRYFTADPRNVEHILKTRFENYPKGAMFRALLHDLLGGGIFNSDGASWRAQRKAASYEFATRSLRDLIVASLRKETASRLLPILEEAAARGRVLDLQDIFGRFTFDSICQIGFGIDLGCLRPELPLVPFAKAFDTANRLTAARMMSAPAVWRLKRALRIGSERTLWENMRVVNAFTADLILRRTREVSPGGAAAAGGCGEVPEEGKEGPGIAKSVPLAEKETEGKAGGSAGSGAERVDLLSRFVQMAADSEDGFSSSFLQDVVANFIIAGRDTSAAGLTWLFWLLSQHPEVEEKIFREAQAVVLARPRSGGPQPPQAAKESAMVRPGVATSAADMAGCNGSGPDTSHALPRPSFPAGARDESSPAGLRARGATCQADGEAGRGCNCSPPGGGQEAGSGAPLGDSSVFTYEELKEDMPYLHAAVSEALRLYPPVPMELKVAVEEDTLPDGTHVPAGAHVTFDLYSMARLESVWGPDCLEFRPERWLDGNGHFVAQSSFRFPVFVAGPRACLGREMAYLLMKMVAASFLLRFRFRPAGGGAAGGKYKTAITLIMDGGLPVTLSMREGGAAR